MAFKRQGADKHQNIKVIKEEKKDKKLASVGYSNIVCPHCGKVIGTKTGEIYAILDKQFLKLAGQTCPKCGKTL